MFDLPINSPDGNITYQASSDFKFVFRLQMIHEFSLLCTSVFVAVRTLAIC